MPQHARVDDRFLSGGLIFVRGLAEDFKKLGVDLVAKGLGLLEIGPGLFVIALDGVGGCPVIVGDGILRV